MTNRKRPALFLDRDGVINKEVNYLYKIEDFIFIPHLFDTCRLFQDAGYALIVVTNQSGIARGYYTEDDFHHLNRWMTARFLEAGIALTDVFYCPHHPNARLPQYRLQCSCRKPQPGMILEASERHQIDLSHSIMVGDKLSDIQAARQAGVGHLVLVHSGYDITDKDALEAHHVAEDMGQTNVFAKWFLQSQIQSEKKP
ncbi:MAG: D-glycero-beta-D-manno-heptose 1,7-bisphosphate 7-phosphatase [Magnetococcus sp. THC-1_WYH]